MASGKNGCKCKIAQAIFSLKEKNTSAEKPTTYKEGLKAHKLNGWQAGCNKKRVRGQKPLARFFCAAWNDRTAFLRFRGI